MTRRSPRYAMTRSGRSAGRLLLAAALAVAALVSARPAAAQYTEMGEDTFRETRLGSGLTISGTLHARAGSRGGVFVQMGVSGLRWDSYYYNTLEYTYDELVEWFGDRVPAREISDGRITPEFQLSSVTTCALSYHVKYALDLGLAGVEDMEDGVFNGIMSEYTYSIAGMERQDDDDARRDARCITEHEGLGVSVNVLGFGDHYFPVEGEMVTIEARLQALLDEREAAATAAKAADGDAVAFKAEGGGGGGGGSGAADDEDKDETEDEDGEEEAEDRPERERSASEAHQENQLFAMSQAAELERSGDRLAAAGNYEAARRAYMEAYQWVARPELLQKAERMELRGGSQAAGDAVVTAMAEEVDRPNEILDYAGYLQLGGGSFSADGADLGRITVGMGLVRNWAVGSNWAISGEIDGAFAGGLGSGCDAYGLSYSDCPDGTFNGGNWFNIQGFVGLNWQGIAGVGYGVMGTTLTHERVVDANIEEHEGAFVVQEAGYGWIGTRQKRGGLMARVALYATGELLAGERTVDQPYLSSVVYRAEIGMNMLYLRGEMFDHIYFSGEGPETDSYGWTISAGYRFIH